MACACRNKNKTTDNDVSNDITVEPVAIYTDPVINNGSVNKDISRGTDNTTIETAVNKSAFVNKAARDNDAKLSIQNTHYSTQSEAEAAEINLNQCYLCAKKHVVRAQEFFQEYHTGYPDHVKNLVHSVKVAESKVMMAFLLYQKIMGQLNMAEGELLGRDANGLALKEEHVSLANRLRNQRLRLSDDPLYVPDFDQLLVDINILQYRVLGAVDGESR